MGRIWKGLVFAGLLGVTVGSVMLCTRRALAPTVGVDSPAVSTTLVMLGGSRGILAEVLWWRIAELQRQHRYAEVVPLTDLLLTLEPTSEEAWAYHAHNLAYNISVAHDRPEERWEWVKRGLEVLERGLRIQPKSEKLLNELGGVWEDKIGGNLDTAARYYRAHTMDVPLPEDRADFERRLGMKADWANPRIRALYWYDRSGAEYRRFRVTMGLMAACDDPAFLPYYVKTIRETWPLLGEADRESLLPIFHSAALAYPECEDLRLFLREVENDSNNR